MSGPSLLEEPGRVDEPQAAQDFSAALAQAAMQLRTMIVRRNGEGQAAVVPLEHLELLREDLARQEVEKRATRIDWDKTQQTPRPPQTWSASCRRR